jgi:hypothetical protein
MSKLSRWRRIRVSLDAHRSSACRRTAASDAEAFVDNDGMTKTYNRFHKFDERSEPIRRLRDPHDEMDRAILRAYGWNDLADELRPEFLTEEAENDHTYQGRYFWRDRVLARLLALNAERHAEEIAGPAPAARAGFR